MDTEPVEIIDHPADGRYELLLDGHRIGAATYVRRGDVLVIPHTETSPAYGGRGFASRLIRFVLDDVAARGLQVDPVCPFVDSFLRRHPEYEHLRAGNTG